MTSGQECIDEPLSKLMLVKELACGSLPILFKTLTFACEKHANQRRKDPAATPYINHPIGVASLLVEGGVTDLATLQAAILHDTIEDTDTTADELETLFGPVVCQVVLECTDDMSLPSPERKLRQVAKATHVSQRARLVKLADKLYNLRDLCRAVPVGWSPSRVQDYYRWAKQVTDQLAGANPFLDTQLIDLYRNGTFTYQGQIHPCYPESD
ncbi:Guanosine-3',5'-bis(diphosphate) 3'-pyrophosphohydrolase MESH1 [Dispira simplex]|nr:Guanosine-3',5'-bis(diphosphate) 3'-pyrophosphohydrolase MESH1 [Dispira simplex]